MSGYFSTYGPRWLNPTQLVRPFCREASRLCSWLKGRVVRDGASCECRGLQSCKGRLQAEREEVMHAEPARHAGGGVSLRDVLRGGQDVLGSMNSKELSNRPWALCSLFSAFLSLPSPAFVVSEAGSHSPLFPTRPQGDSPFQRLAWCFCKGRDMGWKGSRAGFSLLREDERFPSLQRPGTAPGWPFYREMVAIVRDLWGWRCVSSLQRWVAAARPGARTLLPGQGVLAGCSGALATTHAALCWGEVLCFASSLLPPVQPKYLLNFISLFPA